MNDKMHTPLSESDELLLMRLFDGQCSFLERGRAQRLLEQSSEASHFYASLRASATALRTSDAKSSKVDLWDAVSRRIESEEHAALFLGKRETAHQLTFRERIVEFFSNSWNLGMSGAVVTAGLALFFVFPFRSGSSSKSDQMVELVRGVQYDVPSNQVANASVQPVGSHGRPQILDEQAPNVVEVDWMRSDGRLRMLHEPTESSAIIWVRRRNPSAQVKQNRFRQPLLMQQATPFAMAMPTK